ncbi:diphosphate--fructose-6-phosphate 1-phosphotransferase [Desulfosporosinus sp. BICA1-9]|uniref:diphosphate--fructose-6-phosphate 1-phosphotransferase n=1 Tax=Desulfosporosinus sp. BICA1-9 TaxID=1531958 RepID=UPI00054C519A|nr:diphosphate--fructose-6-phosphate 1-phosphotransferase [Desulfosporosinus sp. BICA1-9]KJS78066.1 MAG: 6-phosphofructokinase [Desulfosporosinus sp. BICA1-9]HBW34145.1 diphosphate--fructose-6-phosphate 1-phosphotransferase [Desulfosporosinus sp.]
MKANVAIVQAGGPTSVLNASLAGFLEAAASSSQYNQILGFCNGIEGLIKNRAMCLGGLDKAQLEALKNQPGAVLGSGRYPLTPEGLSTIRSNLQLREISQLVLVGGNGTMWAADQVAAACPDVQVVGIPKTVDNDLWGTDHSPGYLSAAKFIGEAVRSLALDLWAMRNFERVRVVEVMGRNVGWLAAAASLAQISLPDYPPIHYYLPEHSFDLESFFTKVNEHLNNYPCMLVVVSEGIRSAAGNPIAEFEIGGSKVPGGAAQMLSSELRNRGIPSRSEVLGILQRANTWSVCERDRQEAIFLGRQAVEVLGQGKSKVMLGLPTEAIDFVEGGKAQLAELKGIAGLERPVDPCYLTESGIDPSFTTWLQNKMGEPLADANSARQVWELAAEQFVNKMG